ncbi:MAG: ADP compounds hydrolase NudE [Gammaproteobacteria bacterium]
MSRKPPIVHATRTVAQSRIFRVEELELEFSNGTRTQYERIAGSAKGAVLIIAMPDPEHFYLVREYGAGSERYELSFPKGRLEMGEDVLEGANREIMEELGYGANRMEELKELSLSPGYLRSRSHIVLAQDLYPQSMEGDEPEELDVSLWSLNDVDQLLTHPEFTDARGIAALLLLERRFK